MGQNTKNPIYVCENVLQQVMDFIEEPLYPKMKRSSIEFYVQPFNKEA